jgi:hypothetical protein
MHDIDGLLIVVTADELRAHLRRVAKRFREQAASLEREASEYLARPSHEAIAFQHRIAALRSEIPDCIEVAESHEFLAEHIPDGRYTLRRKDIEFLRLHVGTAGGSVGTPREPPRHR